MKKAPPSRIKKLAIVKRGFDTDIIVKPIANKEDFIEAVGILSGLNNMLDEVIAEKEKVTKPLNEALKAERARFKPYEDKLSGAIEEIRRNMSQYQTLSLQRQRETERKEADSVASGTVSIEKAISNIEKAGTGVIKGSIGPGGGVGGGSVKFRTDRVVKITDAQKILRKFLIPDLKLIKEALLAGQIVEGCVLEEVQVVVNSR